LPRMIRGNQIYKGSIDVDRMKHSAILQEISHPIVTKDQSVTSATLTTLIGYYLWRPSSWNGDLIAKVEVELEYESAGAGDIDLYNVSDGTKLADLATPTAAQTHTIIRADVTSAIKALSANKILGIQAAGDGTNALTVYKATLIVTVST